jgi:hypothetical protein
VTFGILMPLLFPLRTSQTSRLISQAATFAQRRAASKEKSPISPEVYTGYRAVTGENYRSSMFSISVILVSPNFRFWAMRWLTNQHSFAPDNRTFVTANLWPWQHTKTYCLFQQNVLLIILVSQYIRRGKNFMYLD